MTDDRFFTEQSHLLQRMTTALVEATPEWWDHATLEVERGEAGFGYKITNHEYSGDIVTPTDELYEMTFKLQDLFETRGKLWRKAVLDVVRIGDAWSSRLTTYIERELL